MTPDRDTPEKRPTLPENGSAGFAAPLPPQGRRSRLQRFWAGLQSCLSPIAPAFLRLANEQPGLPVPEGSGDSLLGCANEFQILQDKWLIIPYGDAKYKQHGVDCIQRLTHESAGKMVAMFNSVRGKLTRRFGGLPFYVGHPDHPELEDKYADTKSYGWIMAMNAGTDGLALEVNWSEPGHVLVANAHYKYFSPFWLAKVVGMEHGKKIAEPTWLQSCGFTNNPNWPVYPLANENINQPKEGSDMGLLEKLRAIIGLDSGTEDDVVSAVTHLVEAAKKIREAVDAKWDAESAAHTALDNSKPLDEVVGNVIKMVSEADTALANEKTAKEAVDLALANEKTAKTEIETSFGSERKERIVLLVNEAVVAGKVLPADVDSWQSDLEADFDGKSVELANAKQTIKTAQKAGNLGGRNGETQAGTDTEILTLVNEKREKTGLDYHNAFLAVKRESPSLFAKEEKPQG